jgi:hypothetical protein
MASMPAWSDTLGVRRNGRQVNATLPGQSMHQRPVGARVAWRAPFVESKETPEKTLASAWARPQCSNRRKNY